MYDLRKEIFERLQRLPMSFFDRSPVGRLVTRVTTDVDALNDLFAAGIAAMVNDAFVLLCIGAVMMWNELAARAGHIRRAAADHDRHMDLPRPRARRQPPHPHGHRAHQFVPAGTHQRHERRAALQSRAEIAGAVRRIESHPHGSLQGRDHWPSPSSFPRSNCSASTAIAIVFWYGGLRSFAGAVTVGVLIAFMQYAQRFFRPIQDLSEKFNILQSAMAACERIFKLLDEPLPAPPAEAPLALTAPRGEIEFRNVWFAYHGGANPKDDDWVLRDVSFHVAPGQTLAIVGHTGAGKTTLIQLLLRFYEIQRGQILLDGVDIRRLRRAATAPAIRHRAAGPVPVHRHAGIERPPGR